MAGVSKDEAPYRDTGGLMVRDAQLRCAPHHEEKDLSRRPLAARPWVLRLGRRLFCRLRVLALKLLREQRDGPRVDVSLVPLLDDVEVGLTRPPAAAPPPALALEIVRGGGEHVILVADQIGAAI